MIILFSHLFLSNFYESNLDEHKCSHLVVAFIFFISFYKELEFFSIFLTWIHFFISWLKICYLLKRLEHCYPQKCFRRILFCWHFILKWHFWPSCLCPSARVRWRKGETQLREFKLDLKESVPTYIAFKVLFQFLSDRIM